jgi:response regulator RpfG family c-di-GMP phosphodiesterase
MMRKDLLKYKRVLIVDDEPDVLETMEALLPMCDVVKASTFKKGKEILEAEHLDIAILDIMGVDGYKLLEIANKRKVILRGGGCLFCAQRDDVGDHNLSERHLGSPGEGEKLVVAVV